jgi:hypothetical protein
MSDLLQPGRHPDADQLNALIEHALPFHEQQQTLAHLAICADCREIVSLSQQCAPHELQETRKIVARWPWFFGWNVAWPVSAAVACILIFAIHLHTTRVSINKDTIATTAEVQKTPLSPPIASPVPPTQPKPAPNKQPIGVPPSALSAGALTDANAGGINGTSQSESVNSLPRRDRDVTSLSHAGTASPFGSPHGSAYRSTPDSREVTNAGPASAVVGGLLSSSVAAQARPYNAGTVNQMQQQKIDSAPRQDNQAISSEHLLNPRYQAAAAPPLMAPSVAVSAGVSQTVEVPGPTSMVATAAFGQSQTAKELPSLPSHLPVLSVVSNTRQTLAIDTDGALFLSKDRVSWQAIEPQWTGRAVKVRVVQSSPPSGQTAFKDTEGSPTSHGLAMSMGAPIVTVPPSVFELTTDAGVIWTSIDGQTWKQK